MANPDNRSKRYWEKQGYLVGKVERRNGYVAYDLFGFLDLIAIKPGEPVIGIQCTSNAHMSDRTAKVVEHENYAFVKDCGWRIVVQGWDTAVRGDNGLKSEMWL